MAATTRAITTITTTPIPLIAIILNVSLILPALTLATVARATRLRAAYPATLTAMILTLMLFRCSSLAVKLLQLCIKF